MTLGWRHAAGGWNFPAKGRHVVDVLKVAVQDAARGSLPRRAKVDAMGDHVGAVLGDKVRVVDGSLGKGPPRAAVSTSARVVLGEVSRAA